MPECVLKPRASYSYVSYCTKSEYRYITKRYRQIYNLEVIAISFSLLLSGDDVNVWRYKYLDVIY